MSYHMAGGLMNKFLRKNPEWNIFLDLHTICPKIVVFNQMQWYWRFFFFEL